MQFRTEIKIAPLGTRIDYADRILLFGSCFADEMRLRMRKAKFRAARSSTRPPSQPCCAAPKTRPAQQPPNCGRMPTAGGSTTTPIRS